MKIFMVFGSDLTKDENGKVAIGPDTKKACRLAVELCKSAGNSSIITATAGAPQKKIWGDVWMAKLMAEYMQSVERHVCIKIEKADTFNTFGEAKAFASALPRLVAQHRLTKVDEVVVIAKSWHAPRAKMDCIFWLSQNRIDIPIWVESYDSPATFFTSVVRELCATVKDRYLMMHSRNQR